MERDNFTLYRCFKCQFNFDNKDLDNKKLIEVVTIFETYYICQECENEKRG